MAPAKASRPWLATLASCLLLLLQLATPAVQAARLAPAAALGRRALLQVDTPKNDIAMAPLAVLQQSLVAANLSNLAYPGTLLASSSDVENSYTKPGVFKQYATALAAATAGISPHPPTFVQRLSRSVLSPEGGARFLYAFVLPSDAAIYVVFRGTDLTGDIFVNAAASTGEDFNSVQTPFSYGGAAAGNVHSGFLLSLTDPAADSYDSDSHPNSISAYQELVGAIKAAQAAVGAAVPLVLTGHSLGAAQASLAAFMLSRDGFANLSLVTFGCPQVGDADWRAAFQAALGSSSMAWWNMQDPVVQVPNIDEDPGCYNVGSHNGHLTTCVQNWFTVGARYRIDTVGNSLRCGIPAGGFAVCDSRSNSTAPANSQSCYTDIDWATGMTVQDHYITNYISNLQACIASAGGN